MPLMSAVEPLSKALFQLHNIQLCHLKYQGQRWITSQGRAPDQQIGGSVQLLTFFL